MHSSLEKTQLLGLQPEISNPLDPMESVATASPVLAMRRALAAANTASAGAQTPTAALAATRPLGHVAPRARAPIFHQQQTLVYPFPMSRQTPKKNLPTVTTLQALQSRSLPYQGPPLARRVLLREVLVFSNQGPPRR